LGGKAVAIEDFMQEEKTQGRYALRVLKGMWRSWTMALSAHLHQKSSPESDKCFVERSAYTNEQHQQDMIEITFF
jgi:hypothetical protein